MKPQKLVKTILETSADIIPGGAVKYRCLKCGEVLKVPAGDILAKPKPPAILCPKCHSVMVKLPI